MNRFLLSAIVFFVAAAVLALTTPSTWPLLIARIALIVLGIAGLIAGLRLRRQGLSSRLASRE